jgi:hypothetical protein
MLRGSGASTCEPALFSEGKRPAAEPEPPATNIFHPNKGHLVTEVLAYLNRPTLNVKVFQEHR